MKNAVPMPTWDAATVRIPKHPFDFTRLILHYTLLGESSQRQATRAESVEILRSARTMRSRVMVRHQRGKACFFGLLLVVDGLPYDRLLVQADGYFDCEEVEMIEPTPVAPISRQELDNIFERAAFSLRDIPFGVLAERRRNATIEITVDEGRPDYTPLIEACLRKGNSNE